jgi:hypothetical protein
MENANFSHVFQNGDPDWLNDHVPDLNSFLDHFLHNKHYEQSKTNTIYKLLVNFEYYNVISGFQLRMYLCELGLGQVHLIVLFLQQILQIFNLKAAMNEIHPIWRKNRVEFISTSFYFLSLFLSSG